MNRSLGRCALVVAITLWVAAGSFAQWSPTAMPDGGIVYSLAVVDTTLFAGTANGIFRSSDYGASWSPAGFGDTTIWRMAASDGKVFAIVGTRLFVSGDYGVTWTRTNPDPYHYPVSFVGSTVEGVWAIVALNDYHGTRKLYLSTDYGESWKFMGNCPGSADALAANSEYVFMGNSNGVSIAERTDSTLLPFNPVNVGSEYGYYGVNALSLSESRLLAGSAGGGLYKSDDLATFQPTPNIDLTSAVMYALLTDGSNLIAGTQNGIFRTADNGSHWTIVGLPHTDVWALARIGSYIFAGAASGVSRSDDGGTTWTDMHNGLQIKGALTLVAQDDTLMLGTQAGLFRSTDGGESWASLGLSNEYIFTVVFNGSDIYAGARSGLYRSTDNGLTWIAVAEGLQQSTYTLLITPTVWLKTGYYSWGIYRSTDLGATWTNCPNTPNQLVQFALVNNTLIASSQGVYRSTDDGLNWEFDWENAMSLRLIWDLAVRNDILYAASGTQVFVSPDAGLTWTEMSAGLKGGHVERFTNYGTYLLASTVSGIAVLPENATAWTPINMDGMADTRSTDLAVTSTEAFVLAGGGELTEGARGLWKRPMDQVFCCINTTGNVNLSGVVDLSDLTALVNYLTGGGYVLPCPAAANVNGMGIVDLGDLSALVSFLTGGGFSLPACN